MSEKEPKFFHPAKVRLAGDPRYVENGRRGGLSTLRLHGREYFWWLSPTRRERRERKRLKDLQSPPTLKIGLDKL